MTIDDEPAGPPHPPVPADEPQDEATGLPWPGVYAVVLVCFVSWVVLLVALERSF
jgi:hypothetical protein